MLTLCLDIGGTKIAAGLADPAGTLVHTAQRPTPAYGGAEQVWAAVAEMIADALGVAGGAVGGVGIASAGPIDLHSGRVSPINIGSWGGFPLRDRVAAAVPGVPVRLGGDGVCMALGEHWLGAGRGARFLLGLVVSTGVGGGLVLDGAPVSAAPATPVTSATWWWIRMARRARAGGVAVWRPSRPARRWRAGRGPTAGPRRPGPAPKSWPRRLGPETRWRCGPSAAAPRRWPR